MSPLPVWIKTKFTCTALTVLRAHLREAYAKPIDTKTAADNTENSKTMEAGTDFDIEKRRNGPYPWWWGLGRYEDEEAEEG